MMRLVITKYRASHNLSISVAPTKERMAKDKSEVTKVPFIEFHYTSNIPRTERPCKLEACLKYKEPNSLSCLLIFLNDKLQLQSSFKLR